MALKYNICTEAPYFWLKGKATHFAFHYQSETFFETYLLLFREFVIYTFIFTAIALLAYVSYGWRAFPFIFWTKILGFCFTGLFFYCSSRHYLHFFHNLGYSTFRLVVWWALSDLLFLSLSISLTNLFW